MYLMPCVSIFMHKYVLISQRRAMFLFTHQLWHSQTGWRNECEKNRSPSLYQREKERDTGRQRNFSPLTPSAFSPASTHPIFLSSVFLIHAGKEHLQESMRSWERAVSHYKNIAFHTSCLYAVNLQQDLIRLACSSARSSIKLIIVSSSN